MTDSISDFDPSYVLMCFTEEDKRKRGSYIRYRFRIMKKCWNDKNEPRI